MRHQASQLSLALLILVPTAGAQKDLYDETVLRTLILTFAQTNWQTQLTANYASKTYIKATMSIDGLTFKDVGVRYRGNSSYKVVKTAKKPFKIKIDAFGNDDDLFGYHTLNLNNGFRDPSLVREVLAYRMFRRFEPAPKANWVKLVINGQNYGVYINVEQINKDMLRGWFEDDSGLRYRGERGPGSLPDDPGLKWLGPTLSTYSRAYELKSANPANPWVNLVKTCDVLNNTPTSQLHSAAPQIVDIDQCIRYLAGNNLLPAIDSYIGNSAHNFYIYEDPLHGRTSVLPWDLNAAFGANQSLTIKAKQQLGPFYKTHHIHRPLLSRVILDPEWKQRYIAHMRAMMADFYDWSFAAPIVTEYQKLIATEVQLDPLRLYPFQQFTPSLTQDLQVFIANRMQWVPGIKPMMDNRRAYLKGRSEFLAVPPTVSNLTQSPRKPKDQDTVWITARASSAVGMHSVKLYWRHVGAYRSDPMFDDGRHNDGRANDGVYGASIPPHGLGTEIEYYVGGRSHLGRGGAMAFLPATAGHRPPHFTISELSQPVPLVINEVLADNKSVDQDQAGDFDDWAEIHNSSNTTVSIAGHYLSDDFRNPKKWQFPAGSTIPGGGFLRVWLDNEPNEGIYHATFKLDKNGERVVLTSPQGRVLDILEFGDQKEDRSFGRLPDGRRGLFFLWTPSGGAPALGATIGKTLRFDIRRTGNPNDFDLVSPSVPRVGNLLDIRVGGAPANATAILGISLGLEQWNLGALGPLFLDATAMLTIPIPTDATGFGRFTATIPASTQGHSAYFQAAAIDLSNGLAVRFTR